MKYDIIYPCDLDPFGECPKRYKDKNCCSKCVGYTVADIDEYGEDDISK